MRQIAPGRSSGRVGLLVLCCYLACEGPPSGTGALSLYRISEIADWRAQHGIFLVETIAEEVAYGPVQACMDRPRNPTGLSEGRFVRIRVLEQLTAPLQPLPGGRPDWRLGDEHTIRTRRWVDEMCDGKGAPPVGTRVVAVVSAAGVARAPDGADAYTASGMYKFFCMEGDRVLLQDKETSDGPGLLEEAQVTLVQLRRMISVAWPNSVTLEVAAQIRESCGAVQCTDGETCFFGEGCARVSERRTRDEASSSAPRPNGSIPSN
ncbi:MAG: hypothetical protein HY904_03620 [Deltaproteobacteria bacterium]|nr:hypothetical protein [Deltaproteobacteria bacterium]